MSAPSLKWYDNANALVTTAPSFTGIVPGIATAAQTFKLINNKGGSSAETTKPLRLKVVVRDPGETDYEGAGREWADGRYIQIRITGGYNKTVATTGWQTIGAGSYLRLPSLANDEGVVVDVRVLTAPDTDQDAVEFSLRISAAESNFAADGLVEMAGGPGISLGLYDSSLSYLLQCANVVQNPGGVDDRVQLQDMVGITTGEPFGYIQNLIQVTNTDGASSALASGERYSALLTIAPGGTPTITKGNKTSGAITSANKPAIPTDHIGIAYVVREFDGLINNVDIENIWTLGAYAFSSAGLTGTLGFGFAVVDNYLTEHDFGQPVSLTASSTNYIWRKADGSCVATTTFTRPEHRAMLLYIATTDGSGVTTLVDRRRFLGSKLHTLRFQFEATLAATQTKYNVLPIAAGARLRPVAPVVAALHANGGTGGQTRFDIEVDDGGFTTIFTSQGTASRDRRPNIAYNASDLVHRSAVPEVFPVKPYARIRCVVDEIPTGGAPTGATVMVLLEEAA
jgi:hypothetical protein